MFRNNTSAVYHGFLIFLFAFAADLCAAETLSTDKAEALRKRFELYQQGTRSWIADFTQTLSAPGLKTPVVSEGKIRYRAPDGLRIDFEKPSGDFMLALGDDLFVLKSNKGILRKSIQTDSVGKPLLGLLGMLRGQPTAEADFFNFQVHRTGEVYEIVLSKKPGAPAQVPSQILNLINVDTLDIKSVVVVFSNGGSINYTFHASSRNRPIEASFFDTPQAR